MSLSSSVSRFVPVVSNSLFWREKPRRSKPSKRRWKLATKKSSKRPLLTMGPFRCWPLLTMGPFRCWCGSQRKERIQSRECCIRELHH
ncbi:unnamed protein product [Strongylus vulgaris]|uniref:Uncharacterized protein n=1 Tax=Strongylus vulgaris TaxID=40348 RepID=A0A3P7J6B6_STRVU|nr:unnamed protein product [Strongylus vulgaris]